MKTSQNHLLLLLLRLFLSSFTCHAVELVDFSGVSQISKHSQVKPKQSSDPNCPEREEISPCVCNFFDYGLRMDCSLVTSEDELRKVFTAKFPRIDFYLFQILFNTHVKVLEDGVFGDVTFETILVTESPLETVQPNAMTSSLSTLRRITIQRCKLSTFPFERLSQFPKLNMVSLVFNEITSVPPLSSKSLTSIELSDNPLATLSADVFKGLSNATAIFLPRTQMTDIPPGMFSGLPSLQVVDVSYNNIARLHDNTFPLTNCDGGVCSIDLNYNNISIVDKDTFKGLKTGSIIDVKFNTLTILEEDVWRPVLEQSISLFCVGNPLVCKCDIAWLVRDRDLVTRVTGSCVDGTDIADLNPEDYVHC